MKCQMYYPVVLLARVYARGGERFHTVTQR